jgi:hypothetical protein
MVEIPPDLAVLNDIDEVVAPGLYFGSLWLGDYQTLDETFVSDMSEAARDALYNVLALDLVIYNVDRKFPDVLCSDGGARDGKLALIDHGNALGGANWNLASLKKLETAQLPARDCRLIYHLLVDENRAKAGAERVAAAIEPQLTALLNRVCAAYPLERQVHDALADVLGLRLAKLHHLMIEQMKLHADCGHEKAE